MKSIKFVVVLFLIFAFCLPVAGEKRRAKKSMKELTDPNSPSYVPYPYPKKREEIIADLYYYIEKYCKPNDEIHESSVDGGVPVTDMILLDLLEPQPVYKIWKIIKVKNRAAELADNYSWLILIKDRDGDIAMRVALLASGLMASGGATTIEDLEKFSQKERTRLEKLRKFRSDDEIKNILSDSLGYVIGDQDIKKMERVASLATIGNLLHPVWEIKMKDGKTYYYSEIWDMVYSIDKKLPWKKNSKGYRNARRSMVSHKDYLPNTEDDEFVILKRIPRKKKD
jgi:hypothetical protein